jgi:UDP-N-acetylmuramoyl-L-alanyl-D-glutamate--2,6-diaminopimelate ligase
MKKLKDILPHDFITEVNGNTDMAITGLALDSRKVAKGFLFAALPGTQSDGSEYINSSIEKGAAAILCDTLPAILTEGIAYIISSNTQRAIALTAGKFYNNPTDKLELVGITGTNGKTTTASLLFQLFRNLGYKCGLLSTTGILINELKLDATHTTPDAITLNAILNDMVEADCEYAFMEVSSHAVVQERIYGLNFKGAIFTNLTHDHLDYHKTFENYRNAKKAFFDKLDLEAFALTNIDDKNGRFMLQNSKALKATYSLESPADFKAKILEYDLLGMQLQMDGEEIFTTLSGRFNAYNLMAVYGAARLLDVSKEDALQAITTLQGVEGRFSCIRSHDNITGIIDYAHTPDALENILESIREINTANKRIITVVGCGGNRDKAKRPVMARIAASLSDKLILTSDNPRNEKPEDILAEMEAGLTYAQKKDVITITERKQAIKTACSLANKGDIILVAGKGHEKYQEINGERQYFDDRQVLAEYLNERK